MFHQPIIAFAKIYLIYGSTYLVVSLGLNPSPIFSVSIKFRIAIGLAGYMDFKNEGLSYKNGIIKFSVWGIIFFGPGVVAVWA